MVLNYDTTESFAIEQDKIDELAEFQSQFNIPENTIYVDGNSLGLMSKISETKIKGILDEWKTLAITGWWNGKQPWFNYSEMLGAKISPLVGAEADEIVATGTTTVNIHALVSSFYTPSKNRYKILADELNFPTDLYALKSQIMLKGYDPKEALILTPSKNGLTLEEEDIIELMSDDVALILLPSVLYRSGQLLDIPYLTKEAHKREICIGFDCSHSVGAIPHEFDAWDIDFAMWCSYKYLNSGPGAPAFLYVNKKHFDVYPGLAGWFGNNKETQFDLSNDFEPAPTAGRWQISSPSIMGSASIDGSLDVLLDAGISKIRKKSLNLTSYLMYLVDELLTDSPYNFKIGTPRDAKKRGGHVALIHESKAEKITKALLKRNIITDFRPENIIRIAPTALYNTFHDIWTIVQTLKDIIDKKDI